MKYGTQTICLSLIFSFLMINTAIADEGLVGHYYLEQVRETGSELILKETGEFEWMLSQGSVDQFAKGKWSAENGKVILDVTPAVETPTFRFLSEDEMNFAPVEAGTWVAAIGVLGVAPLSNIEVRFLSKSGKIASAITKQNGDAIVTMPATEIWARAGLRTAGGTGSWQWFDINDQQAIARGVAFAARRSEIRSVPFKQLQLIRRKNGLGFADNDVGGIYVKH